MSQSPIAGETGALDAEHSVVRMQQRRQKLFDFYANLKSQADSAIKRCNLLILSYIIIGSIAYAAAHLFPKLDYLVALALTLYVLPASGFTIHIALSTLNDMGRGFRDGVIMVDEFRHDLHNFTDSGAGREMGSLGKLQKLTYLTRRARFKYFELWIRAAGAAAMYGTWIYGLLLLHY